MVDDIRSELHKLVDQVEDEDVLNICIELLQGSLANDDVYPDLSGEERSAIEKGIAQMDRGEGKSFEEIRDAIRQKLGI